MNKFIMEKRDIYGGYHSIYVADGMTLKEIIKSMCFNSTIDTEYAVFINHAGIYRYYKEFNGFHHFFRLWNHPITKRKKVYYSIKDNRIYFWNKKTLF